MLLTEAEINNLSPSDRAFYLGADLPEKEALSEAHRTAWAEGATSRAAADNVASANRPSINVGLWLMVGGVIFVLIGFFYDVGVGSEFDRVVNIGKLGEKFAFLFTGLGLTIIGSIFWNADRIVEAAQARQTF